MLQNELGAWNEKTQTLTLRADRRPIVIVQGRAHRYRIGELVDVNRPVKVRFTQDSEVTRFYATPDWRIVLYTYEGRRGELNIRRTWAAILDLSLPGVFVVSRRRSGRLVLIIPRSAQIETDIATEIRLAVERKVVFFGRHRTNPLTAKWLFAVLNERPSHG